MENNYSIIMGDKMNNLVIIAFFKVDFLNMMYTLRRLVNSSLIYKIIRFFDTE